MATIKKTEVQSKVTRVYTLADGTTEVTVVRDEAVNTVSCVHTRPNAPVDDVAQRATTFNVQYLIAAKAVNIDSINFGKEGDNAIKDEIKECVLDLANWSVDGE